MTEEILEPDLPIIDPHHHLWDFTPALPRMPEIAHPFGRITRQSPRYLFDELLADCRGAGHNVVGTVFLQCGAFYRADGPAELKPVGEVEFVNGVAAQSASGVYGPFRACAGIVGQADLTLGEGVGAVLDAEIAAGNGRFRGIRHIGAHDPDPEVLGPLGHAPANLYADPRFRQGFAELGPRGLTFDAWVVEPQIGEVTALARAFPDQPIVLDHVGTPLGLGSYAGRHDDRFAAWRAAIGDLATCPNVTVKLGGLAMPFCALGELGPDHRTTAARLADLFRPYVETCIAAFGPARAMFESNFPVDRWGADYATLWNAFKLVARGASADEKRDLFAGAAARFYKVEHLLA
ncbi:Predicted metal-dependent hydrolase, TIM-barrel fold [Sphingomonas sp. OV641]|uniref:amidohydrolase family protein n=1 Tax=unclassified Sphingomonas TaxID=196159 RepID=UPI000836C2BA|nr:MULTISPECIES: amidohydrolase family protein [unclassified Sphingomonas]SEJ86196.1 Predicted metal-dependent hydrolase, TIM-barrel fold [Sphingomonas sp. OV641]